MNLSFSRPRITRLGLLIATVVTGVSLAVLSTIGLPSRAATPPSPSQLTGGFMDRSSGAYLRLQLDPSQAHYGGFVAVVPGVGLVWPSATATVCSKSAHDTQLRYEGSGFLDARATVDPEFGVNYQFSGTQVSTLVRVNGHVDPAHHTGVVELWIDGHHYHLASQADPSTSSSANTAIQAVLSAYRAMNWASLYKLTDTSLTAGETVDQFTALLVSGLQGGRIGDARASGPAVYTTTDAGITFANVPVRLTQISAAGTSQTATVTMRLIYDTGGAWHLLTLA